MKVVNLEKTQRLRISDKNYIGPGFSFFEKLKMGGVGSAQFLYRDGVESWNKINEQFSYKTVCSIELNTKGIVLWMNKKQLVHAALIPFGEIEDFELKGFQINSKPLTQVNEILTAGDMKLSIKDENDITFYVPAPKYFKIQSFLAKNFQEKFHETISNEDAICSEEPLYTSIYLHGLNY